MQGTLSKYFIEAEGVLYRIFLEKGAVLSKFIAERILRHEEPGRQGRIRGTEIGYGRKKIWATFLAATGWNPKQAYDLLVPLGASYGTMRIWYTEANFQKLVLQFQDEISDRFVQRLVDISESEKDISLLNDDAYGVLAMFGAVESYGPLLGDKIIWKIFDLLNRSKTLQCLRAVNVVLSGFFLKSNESNKETKRQIELFLNTHTLSLAYHAIKSPEILSNFSTIQRGQFLNDLRRLVIHSWGKCDFFAFNDFERLVDDNSWISKDVRMIRKVGWVRGEGMVLPKRKRGRPRKTIPEGARFTSQ